VLAPLGLHLLDLQIGRLLLQHRFIRAHGDLEIERIDHVKHVALAKELVVDDALLGDLA
jgi:hypothetical protein